MRVLVPLLDSANFLPAVKYAVRELRVGEPLEVHLLHVPSRFSPRRHADEALVSAQALLERFHVACTVHSKTGGTAQVILDFARVLDVDRIVLGAARQWSATRLAQDSVIEKLLDSASARVILLAGRSVSPLERYALPAGAAGLAALLLTE
jgi:nucleotide-binding universal stress UspA family protein